MYYDPKRRGFNVGTCKKLIGTPYALVIYLDDNESRWNFSAISCGASPEMKKGLLFLETRAREWGKRLSFDRGYYYTDPSENTFVTYNGCVETDIVNNDHSADILDQTAKSLGFSSIDEFHKHIKKFSGREQVMYLIVLNKEGRSYAMSDKINDGRDFVEYCVLFARSSDYKYDSLSSSVAHEVLHLFGAEDYYDPYHKYPKRKLIAEKIYPDDIMLCTYYNVFNSKVGGFTAYSVGWKDTIPNACNCKEWWE